MEFLVHLVGFSCLRLYFFVLVGTFRALSNFEKVIKAFMFNVL